MVFNTGLLDWEFTNLTTRPLLQIVPRAKVYKNLSNEYHYKNFKQISWFIPSNQSEKLNESFNRHRVANTKFFIITRTVTKLSRVTLDFQISHRQLKFHWFIPLVPCCNYLYTMSYTGLMSDSHHPKNCFYLVQWKPFQNYKKMLFISC